MSKVSGFQTLEWMFGLIKAWSGLFFELEKLIAMYTFSCLQLLPSDSGGLGASTLLWQFPSSVRKRKCWEILLFFLGKHTRAQPISLRSLKVLS